MRGASLRGVLLVVSVLFAVAVVGGIALTTYVIVSDSMQVVARRSAERVSDSARLAFVEELQEIELLGRTRGLSGDELDRASSRRAQGHAPDVFTVQDSDVALFMSPTEAAWHTGALQMSSAASRARSEAFHSGRRTVSSTRSSGALNGLFVEARLGTVTSHVPVTLPAGERALLDVTYVPRNEEQVIDAIRLPMTLLAVSAMVIMVVLMQTSMVWVLNLVNDLRKAADSIDAGRLDERLPEEGGNEIGELARSLNRLIERLQRRAEAQARFVADASHELATPVAGIRGYTGILREWGADDPGVRNEAIDAIDRESQRMARLSANLLNLLHADQGLVLKSERFDLNGLARERLAATASRWIDKDIEFIGPQEDSLSIVGDEGRVEDVLSILLDNAAKYTSTGGSVTLSTSRKRDIVIIEVRDTGEGIAEADLERVFDRFFRSDKARAGGESGFGLGLAIAKSIVESMGGTIQALSEPGQGATFRVKLPRGRL